MKRTGRVTHRWLAALVIAWAVPAGCSRTTMEPDPVVPTVPVAAVAITAAEGIWTGTMQVGQSVALLATPLAANGTELPGRSVAWSSTDSAVAAVSADGVVTGRGDGTAEITATIEGRTGRLLVFVTAVGSLLVTPGAAVLQVGQTQQYTVHVYDVAGVELTGRSVVWSTPSPDIVSISPAGLLTALAHGYGQVDAAVDGISSSVALTVTAPAPTATMTGG